MVGPNEAGKSTIQAAIKTAFFGERQGLARWRRWGTEDQACSIKVEYELPDGTAWAIERDLAKNDVRLSQTKGGETAVEGPTQTAKVVCDHLGLDTPDAFANTVFVRVGELANNLKEIEESLRAKVESLLVGSAGGSITAALKSLDTRYKRLAGTVSQKGAGGRIGEILAEEAGLKTELAAAEAAERDRKQFLLDLEETEAALAEKEERLKIVKALVTAIQAKQKVEQRRDEIAEQRQRLRLRVERVKADREKRRSIEAEMAGLAEYKDVTAADAAALQSKLKDARAKEMELAAATDGGQAQAPAPPVPVHLILAAAVAALAAGAGLAAVGRIAAGGLLAVVGIAAGAAAYLLSRPKTPVADPRAVYIKDEIARLDGEIKEVLAKVGAVDAAGFIAKQTKYDSLARELANIVHAESIILEGSSLGTLERDLAALVDQAEVLERQMSGLTSANLSPEEIYSREKELAYLEPEVANLRRARDTLVGRLQSHHSLAVSPAELNAKLACLNEELEKTRRYARAVETAAEEIKSIAAEISGEVAPEIAAKASVYMDKLTSGRYGRVNIAADLTPAVVGESGEIEPAQLSSGTADQLHFAVRLAAADLISGDKKPPVILDDPFVYFDAARTAAAREIIAALAKERQVILFSHDESFKDWPDRTIFLGN